MKKTLCTFILLFACVFRSSGQHTGMTFQKASKLGISIDSLDRNYKSAVHVDTSLAVFKTDSAQEKIHEAYVKLLKDFGKFLSEHNFKWDKPTRCFNRIYFSPGGTIDYFLYNFMGKPEEKLPEEKQKEFNTLLNRFINDYKLEVRASVKFAQCSPTTYMPE